MLWLLFLYIEAAVRLRDLRHMPFHLDLCRPFAAHWYWFFLQESMIKALYFIHTSYTPSKIIY